MQGTLRLAEIYDRSIFPPKILNWFKISQQEAEVKGAIG
jgi:hypothetical protein